MIYVAIDRTRWELVNIFVISLIWRKRAIPIYFRLLPKKGNSNFQEQTELLERVLPTFQNYRVVVLGDRELLSIEEGWFILTNLGSLDGANCLWQRRCATPAAYKKRFGIEEMFRDFKKGGYNLEGTNVEGQRLISLLILISIAYTISTMQGEKSENMGIGEYIGRETEQLRKYKRHSSFYLGLYGETWIRFWSNCSELVTELMNLNRNKRQFYQRGIQAINLIQSGL